jgi:hydroxypyruvate isomerase
MLNFSANLSMLYQQSPFMERFGLAAKDGFKAVEFLFPYDFSKEEIKEEISKQHLKIVLHNLPAGDWAKGERGIACLPDRIDEFKDGVQKAIEYASTLGVKQVNCLAGIKPDDLDIELAEKTLVDNLRYASQELKKADIRLLLEPINNYDIPKFLVNSTVKGIQIIDTVNSDNLFLQYDIYHAQRMEGEISGNINKYFDRIKHIQIADNPGRNEPGTGEINYAYLFHLLQTINYQGWIGCEYKPAGDTSMGLGWINQLTK